MPPWRLLAAPFTTVGNTNWSTPISSLFLRIKRAIRRVPVVSTVCRLAYYRLIQPLRAFPGSGDYWQQRYLQGGSSGYGSYDALAEFKSAVLNATVDQHQVGSLIEFGCGDGNQLVASQYPAYLGVDISPEAIALCRRRFANDASQLMEHIPNKYPYDGNDNGSFADFYIYRRQTQGNAPQ